MKGGRELVTLPSDPGTRCLCGVQPVFHSKERAVARPAPHNWLGYITAASSAAGAGAVMGLDSRFDHAPSSSASKGRRHEPRGVFHVYELTRLPSDPARWV